MATRQYKQSKLKPLLVPACSLLVLGYFAYNAVEGQYGLHALDKLQVRVTDLQGELDTVSKQRADIERHVELLRSDSVDKDLLDERGRATLGFVNAKDLIILINPTTGELLTPG
ncbi:Cell division protein FtsB [Faunimonas pinastri]|uniref:Cell division protein FtsB n=1 Tax=Faunimonas pinastri TaxID=1855383 RepID=A0A1H9N8C6_9HYPH|nr:septum formation initiator family protein [Faunimonas pinastri]SER32148.1 Cell division protein FtsB [Faunimonas pinastri]